jgi:hypothetical protein
MTTSSELLQTYLLDSFEAGKNLKHEELLQRNLQANGGDFLTPLGFYLGAMDEIDPVMISYMPEEQKDQRVHDLKITYLLLCAQKEYELTHQKTENSKKYDALIEHCKTLLDKLNPVFPKAPEQSLFTDGKPVKYLGIQLAKELSNKLVELNSRKTKTIKQAIGTVNEKRLYWVWGSTFIKTMLRLLQDDFYNVTQAKSMIGSLDPYTGALSWALYYFRFSVNLFLLLKHTIKGPWMSDEEAQTPWTIRLQARWSQTKFGILNDFLWGPANMVCYFWLRGPVLGPWGDALTLLLLAYDIWAALKDFTEQEAAYYEQMEEYDREIAALQQKANSLKDLLADEEEEKNRKIKMHQLQMQINALTRARERCEKNWEFQKLSLYNNIGYAFALTFSFVLLATPFMPLTEAAALTLGVVGAVLCFAFTVIANSIRGGIEIRRSQEAVKEAKHKFHERVEFLKELIKQDDNLDENQKRFLFLEIKKYKLETEYQKQMMVLQAAQLIRSIMLEACMPAIIFSSLVFLPMGIGFAPLGAILGLAILSDLLINALLAPDPQMKNLPAFDEKEYKEFCTLISKENDTKAQHSFFKPKATKKQEATDLPSEPGVSPKPSL